MLIERQLLQDLQQHLTQPEITLLTGPRQSGKTTLLHILQEQLAGSGSSTLFLNLDIEKVYQIEKIDQIPAYKLLQEKYLLVQKGKKNYYLVEVK